MVKARRHPCFRPRGRKISFIDQHGQVFQAFDASDASGDSRGIRPIYNARGYVSQIRESREGTAGKIYWT
ncbi:MAG: hypothetical protein ACNA7J_09620, partial [Wenzhouxiangella sp.]